MDELPDPLQYTADKFFTYRNNRVLCKFPTELWQEVIALSKSYSTAEIAQAIGFNEKYVKRRIRELRATKEFQKKALAFTQIQPVFQAPSTCLEFTAINGKPMSIRFQLDVNQLFPLIQSLAGIQS